MVNRNSDSRLLWLAVGLAAGLCISYCWPHEPVAAAGNDRNSKFGILTTPMAPNVEGVFVLDYLTGELSGAVLNSATGQFNHTYRRSVAVDFKVDPKSKPTYAFVAGQVALPKDRRAPFPSASVIYVAELTSGQVFAYKMNYPRTRVPVKTQFLIPIQSFPFREATPR